MAQLLKQSTAATIMFGPFVLFSDGVTLKTDSTTITDIDHASTGIFLSKAGTAAIRHATVTASVADAYGMMKVTLDTTDTGTLGALDVLFAKAASYLPVHKQFMVVPAQIYNSLVAGSDNLDVNALKVGPTGAGTAQTARDLGASVLLSTGTGTGQLDFTSGVVKSNQVQLLGTTVPTPTVAGVPNVNTKTWNDLATVALPLVPTTAGRTLDVSATGEAGVDWANVGSPTTTLNLSGTTVKTVTDAPADSTTLTEVGADVDEIITTLGAAGAGLTGLPAVTLAASQHVIVDSGTITTYTGNTPQTGDTYALANGASGFVATKAVVDETGADADELITTIGVAGAGLTALPTAADITAAVGALTITELASIPGASPTLIQAIALHYMALRNKLDVTAIAKTVYKDSGVPLGAKVLTDDGVTYSETKIS